MWTIYTSKDGPVAAAFSEHVARAAVVNLRRLYPGDRVWQTRSTGADVQRLNLEVLSGLDDAEVVHVFRFSSIEGVESGGYHRDTLRGLVRSQGLGDRTRATAEGLSLTEAKQRVDQVLSGEFKLTDTFLLEDLIR